MSGSLAEGLGLKEARIRVIAPDVGGDFGYKGNLLAEEVYAAYLAMRLCRPIHWIEDHSEQLTGAANCREQHTTLSADSQTRKTHRFATS